jgi:hypothetical protein
MNRPQAPDGLPQPQRLRAMLAVLTGPSMSMLDGAVANIAADHRRRASDRIAAAAAGASDRNGHKTSFAAPAAADGVSW